MVTTDLSHHLKVHSKQQQSNNECDNDAPHPSRDTFTSKRLKHALNVSRVKANRGKGDEAVPCLSFRQASSLGIVVLLLSSVLLDATVLCAVIAGAASTVSMAREIRMETLQRRRERATLQKSSLELRLAMRELERAEAELKKIPLFSLPIDDEHDEPDESC